MAYPIGFETEYGDGERSRILAATGAVFFVKSILLIPHMIILMVLGWAASIAAYVGYWIILITGELPDSLHTFLRNVISWGARTQAWLVGTTDAYPPFEFDPSNYDAVLSDTTAGPERSRGWALVGVIFLRQLAALPNLFVYWLLSIVAFFAIWGGYFIVLFTGSMPAGLADFLTGWIRWGVRLQAWIYALDDEYPPFTINRD